MCITNLYRCPFCYRARWEGPFFCRRAYKQNVQCAVGKGRQFQEACWHCKVHLDKKLLPISQGWIAGPGAVTHRQPREPRRRHATQPAALLHADGAPAEPPPLDSGPGMNSTQPTAGAMEAGSLLDLEPAEDTNRTAFRQWVQDASARAAASASNAQPTANQQSAAPRTTFGKLIDV